MPLAPAARSPLAAPTDAAYLESVDEFDRLASRLSAPPVASNRVAVERSVDEFDRLTNRLTGVDTGEAPLAQAPSEAPPLVGRAGQVAAAQGFQPKGLQTQPAPENPPFAGYWDDIVNRGLARGVPEIERQVGGFVEGFAPTGGMRTAGRVLREEAEGRQAMIPAPESFPGKIAQAVPSFGASIGAGVGGAVAAPAVGVSGLLAGLASGIGTAAIQSGGATFAESKDRLQGAGLSDEQVDSMARASALPVMVVSALTSAVPIAGYLGRFAPSVLSRAMSRLGGNAAGRALVQGVAEGSQEAIEEVSAILSQDLAEGDPRAYEGWVQRIGTSAAGGSILGSGADVALGGVHAALRADTRPKEQPEPSSGVLRVAAPASVQPVQPVRPVQAPTPQEPRRADAVPVGAAAGLDGLSDENLVLVARDYGIDTNRPRSAVIEALRQAGVEPAAPPAQDVLRQPDQPIAQAGVNQAQQPQQAGPQAQDGAAVQEQAGQVQGPLRSAQGEPVRQGPEEAQRGQGVQTLAQGAPQSDAEGFAVNDDRPGGQAAPPVQEQSDSTLRAEFESRSPQHQERSQEIESLVADGTLSGVGADVVREVFNGARPEFLGRFSLRSADVRDTSGTKRLGAARNVARLRTDPGFRAQVEIMRGLAARNIDPKAPRGLREADAEAVVLVLHEVAGHVGYNALLNDEHRSAIADVYHSKTPEQWKQHFGRGLQESAGAREYAADAGGDRGGLSEEEFFAHAIVDYILTNRAPPRRIEALVKRFGRILRDAIDRLRRRGSVAKLRPYFDAIAEGRSPDEKPTRARASGARGPAVGPPTRSPATPTPSAEDRADTTPVRPPEPQEPRSAGAGASSESTAEAPSAPSDGGVVRLPSAPADTTKLRSQPTLERDRGVPQPGTPWPERPPIRSDVVEGDTGELVLPDGRRLPFVYAVVSASDIIPTHDVRRRFAVNEAGDSNERPYHDKDAGKPSREAVLRMAERLDPSLLLTDTPTATDGPPIVTNDLRVVGGNARAMAVQAAYASKRAEMSATQFMASLHNRAQRFGIDRGKIGPIDAPILVRRLTGDAGKRGDLSRVLNESHTTGRTREADAVSRGRQVKPETMDRIAEKIGDDTLASALTGRTGFEIAMALREDGAMSAADFAQFIADGQLTKEGRLAVERTLLGSVIPDVGLMDETPASVQGMILRTAGTFLRLRQASKGGDLDIDRDLADALRIGAVVRFTKAADVQAVVDQGTLAPEPALKNPRAVALAKAFEEGKPLVFADKMRRVGKRVADALRGEMTLGQTEPMTAGQAFDAAFGIGEAKGAFFGRAFHGSPHRFDRFNGEKIGTGEGAQSYGHGLYFAGKEGVAEHYRRSVGRSMGLRDRPRRLLIDGKDTTEVEVDDTLVPPDLRRGYLELHARAYYAPSVERMRSDLEKSIPNLRQMLDRGETLRGDARMDRYLLGDYEAALQLLNERRIEIAPAERAGAVYTVNLKPEEDEYLLWDEPLNRQSEKVQSALRAGGHRIAKDTDARGKQFYQSLRQNVFDTGTHTPQEASAHLRSLGIRGIKYLDQNSRNDGERYAVVMRDGTEHGRYTSREVAQEIIEERNLHGATVEDRATYNYVIFDDADVEIESRYGRRSLDAPGQEGLYGQGRTDRSTGDQRALFDTATMEESRKAPPANQWRVGDEFTNHKMMAGRRWRVLGIDADGRLRLGLLTPGGKQVEKKNGRENDFWRIRPEVLEQDGVLPPDRGTASPALAADDPQREGESDADYAMRRKFREAEKNTGSLFGRPVQTDTPEFKRWFGESKVVNPDGTPRVVFHGTGVADRIERFRRDQNTMGGAVGFWFASEGRSASKFALRRDSDASAAVLPVYLSIVNPKEYQSYAAYRGELSGEWSELTESMKRLRRRLIRAGYDGIVIRNSDTDFAGLRDDWVAFSPTQIKSATGNAGTFDPSNPDIRFGRPIATDLDPLGFYSRLQRTAAAKIRQPMTRAQVKQTLLGNGISLDELTWTGLLDLLDAKPEATVTPGVIRRYIAENRVELREVVKGDGSKASSQDMADVTRQVDQLTQQVRTDAHEAVSQLFGRGERTDKVVRDFMEMARRGQPLEEAIEQLTVNHDLGDDFDPLRMGDAYAALSTAVRHQREMRDGSRGSDTKFESFTLPGGENYREVLLTLPEKPSPDKGPRGWGDTAGGTADPINFRSSHFSEPNIIAHMRLKDRATPDGRRVLFVEEIQSDWHQAGRERGYRDSEPMESMVGWSAREIGPNLWSVRDLTGRERHQSAAQNGEQALDFTRQRMERDGNKVPQAPFSKTWHELAFRRVLRMAAEGGYDALGWTTGEQQIGRYEGLARDVERVSWSPDGGVLLAQGASDRTLVRETGVERSRLADYIGKDAAAALLATEPKVRRNENGASITAYELSDRPVRIGGQGMRSFYDRDLVNYADKIGKRFGAKTVRADVETAAPEMSQAERDQGLDEGEFAETVHVLPVTADMRESLIDEGTSMFARAIDTTHDDPAFSALPVSRTFSEPTPAAVLNAVAAGIQHDRIMGPDALGAGRRPIRWALSAANRLKVIAAEIRSRGADGGAEPGVLRARADEIMGEADAVREVNVAEAARMVMLAKRMRDAADEAERTGSLKGSAADADAATMETFAGTLGVGLARLAQKHENADADAFRAAMKGLSKAQRKDVGRVAFGFKHLADVPAVVKQAEEKGRTVADDGASGMARARKLGLKRNVRGKWLPVEGSGFWMPQVPNALGRAVVKEIGRRGQGPKFAAMVEAAMLAHPDKTRAEIVGEIQKWASRFTRGENRYYERTRFLLPEKYVELDPLKAFIPQIARNASTIAAGEVFGGFDDHGQLPKVNEALVILDQWADKDEAAAFRKYVTTELGVSLSDADRRAHENARIALQTQNLLKLSGAFSALQNMTQPWIGTADFGLMPRLRTYFWDYPPFIAGLLGRGRAVAERAGKAGAVASRSAFDAPDSLRLRDTFDALNDIGLFLFKKSEKGTQVRAFRIGELAAEKALSDLAALEGKNGALRKWAVRVSNLGKDSWHVVERRLQRLGITRERMAELVASGQRLSPDELEIAGWLMVHDTQFLVTTASKPLFYVTHPYVRVLAQYKFFSARQLGLISTRMLKEAMKGNAGPLVAFALAALTARELIAVLRDYLLGEDRSLSGLAYRKDAANARNIALRSLDHLKRGGLLGPLGDMDFGLWSWLGGPTVGTALSIGDAATATVENPADAAKAMRRFFEGESPALRQFQKAWDAGWTKGRARRIWSLRSQAYSWKDDKDSKGIGDEAARIMRRALHGPESFPENERSLTYRYAADAVTVGDTEDAAEYLADMILNTPNAERPKVMSGIRASADSRSPLGMLSREERGRFLATLSEGRRAEAVRLDTRWRADYAAAVMEATRAVARRSRVDSPGAAPRRSDR